MTMRNVLLVFISVFAAYVVWFCFQTRRKSGHFTVKDLPGPGPTPWLVGHIPFIVRGERAGEADFAWMKAFGHAIHIQGPFGRDVLFVSDPKILRHVLNSPRYKYPKSSDMRFRIQLVAGKGLAWAEGTQHARQRKVMNPAFMLTSIKEFMPMFLETSRKAVSKWHTIFDSNNGQPLVLDVHHWLARLSMDTLGGALNYDFRALEDDHSELMSMYKDLMPTAYYKPSNFKIAFRDVCGYLPQWAISLLQSIPSKSTKKLREFNDLATHVANTLVRQQLKLMDMGLQGGKDIMSLLVKANQDPLCKEKIDHDELVSQLRTILVAGHETIASTVAWVLYELAMNPDVQEKLRNEILKARRQLVEEGRSEFGLQDYESMHGLIAVIKETLRFHPILSLITREASQDDILPLMFPQSAKSGKLIREIFVKKGQRIIISFNAYHRTKSVWGEDADHWIPDRFLRADVGTPHPDNVSIGLLSNLLTFSSGDRSCIGWRFALINVYITLTEFVEHFEFQFAPNGTEVVPVFTSLLSPMVKGASIPRVEMPLLVKPVSA